MNQKELVFFLGGKENVSIQLDEGADFETVLNRLTEKLEAGAMLVAGNKLKLEVGGRVLGDEQKQALQKVFSTHGLSDPFHETSAASEKTPEEEAELSDSGETAPEPQIEKTDDEGIRIAEKDEIAASESTETAENEQEIKKEEKPLSPEERTLLVKKTLRSGQSVEYEGNVVILGDVNPGAEVNADGDILIMGALRGTVHAGQNGEKKAIIAALKFQPVQARIANIHAQVPHAASADMLPQVLSLQQDKIKLEKLK